jgi:hypothetical protein
MNSIGLILQKPPLLFLPAIRRQSTTILEFMRRWIDRRMDQNVYFVEILLEYFQALDIAVLC